MVILSDIVGRDFCLISVFFFCNEWNLLKGGLFIFNREFVINLVNILNDKIRVMCYFFKSSE